MLQPAFATRQSTANLSKQMSLSGVRDPPPQRSVPEGPLMALHGLLLAMDDGTLDVLCESRMVSATRRRVFE
jgi:hypothetical protein